MAFDLSKSEDRMRLIQEIESEENKIRKAKSLREYEIFNKRQRQYVLEYLQGQFTAETVREMPIIHAIHLCTRIVKEQASLYGSAPKREFMGVSDELKAKLEGLYQDIRANKKFQSLNQYFKLQSQAHINWTIRNKQLKGRVLLPHHLDVVPMEEDPELGEIYVISGFDKSMYITNQESSPTGIQGRGNPRTINDGVNQDIADPDDAKTRSKRYYVWSPEYNFTMDAYGAILGDSKDISNPIAPLVPFIEVSEEKDFEYWLRSGSDTADFSVQFNGMMSDLQNVVKMQGWGQAVFIGPDNMIPKQFVIGMNSVIRLPMDPSATIAPEFKYVSPQPDIEGSLKTLVFALSSFLSSAGIDPGTITTDGSAQSYTSAIDRLLAMIQEFEASKEDMDTFQSAELRSFEVIKALINVYGGTDILEIDIAAIPEDASISVTYAEPQMIQSEKEELELVEKRISMKLQSRLAAFMQIYKVDEETAKNELEKIDAEAGENASASTTPDMTPPPDQTKKPDNPPADTEVKDGDGSGT